MTAGPVTTPCHLPTPSVGPSTANNGYLQPDVRTPSGHPWRDGTTHIVFEPLAFLERLAALIPRPRAHQLTYHGALAPASTIRSRIVPRPPEIPIRGKGLRDDASDPRYSWAELMKRVFGHDVLRCHNCPSQRQVIALITKLSVIRRILLHVGLPAELPPLAPARPPPGFEFAC